jgi:hypothetical protein
MNYAVSAHCRRQLGAKAASADTDEGNDGRQYGGAAAALRQ